MTSWDDGKHKNVKKIQIKYGNGKIHSFKVDYESDGKLFAAPRRGGAGGDQLGQIELEKGEHLNAMIGYYTETAQGEVITSLKFQTNRRRYGPFGTPTNNFFSLDAPKDNQFLGFFGTSGEFLSEIEAHIGPITPTSQPGESGTGSQPGGSEDDKSVKLEAQGGKVGDLWDDGVYDTVKKIIVGQGGTGVQYIKFEYDVGGQTFVKEHGKRPFIEPEEFELQYPVEYLVRVEGYTDKVFGNEDAIIQSIKFVTNKGKVSQPFGLEGGNNFKLENNGNKIIGFHGRIGQMLSSIGVYTVKGVTPLTPGAKKLEAIGGNGGNNWDEGDFDNVTKIFIGLGVDGIQYIKFEYEKNGGRVSGQDHGDKTVAEEFGLDNPNEYLISVEGSYQNTSGYNSPVIQSIAFKTNVKTSTTYGFETGTPFSMKEEGSKIVGFHGNASKVIHGLGVYVKPITK